MRRPGLHCVVLAVALIAGCAPVVRDASARPTIGAAPTPVSGTTGTPAATGAPATLSATPATATPASSGTPGPTTSAGPSPAPAGSPVAINGQLAVCGRLICNEHGRPVQLRGMSTHGLQWYGWGRCITESSLDALVGDWGADIVRVSMYVQEDGYETNPAEFTQQAETIVDALIARGVYALLDWHMLDPGDPMFNLGRAKAYFGHMSERYGKAPNVLYEIANEPSGVSWATIKKYADELIPVLRANDPDGVVIVGTRAWSSFGVSEDGDFAEIVGNPVDATNVMYTFHFYAASHKAEYRAALEAAADALPVFVTEWGSQQWTGDGPNDFDSAQAYLDILATRKISWISWNYSDDERSGAAFKPGTCPNGPWTGASLKPAGTWVRERLLIPADDFGTN